MRALSWSLLSFVVLLHPSTFLAGQGGVAAAKGGLQIAGGTVAVRHGPVAIPAKPLEDHQRRGTVWSIGAEEAAILDTDIALMAGKTLIPPGTYRLSTWFRDRGRWQLLVFQGPKNFARGTPFSALPLHLRNLAKPRSELTQIEVVESRGAVRLQIFAGMTRLRLTLEPLQVVQHDGMLAGRPAVYEFYSYRADYRIQGRLRNLELIRFGRVREEGPFGAVYDISCKSDGNGIFVICHSDTLQKNRDLLAAKSRALRTHPDDENLRADVAALKGAVERQSGLQRDVMVPGEVEKVDQRAARLGVRPSLGSDGTSFELSFGIRKAKFTLNEKQFRKLEWR